MRISSLTLLTVAASISFAAAAQADRLKCPAHPRSEWLSIDAAIRKAEALGYRVRSAKPDDGCWEIKGYDRNGSKVELNLDPVSGEPVAAHPAR
ncbi:MAG: PepSY domain-containing protein [Hyphomicrobiales bacterium]|nr:PepSY domain-containing protein [Hyphomicrobiales bacterium]